MFTATRFLFEENGQGLTEYTLILSILILSVIVAVSSVGTKVSNLFSNASAQIN